MKHSLKKKKRCLKLDLLRLCDEKFTSADDVSVQVRL